MKDKTYGILTSGGDCPGLNAVIRNLVRFAHTNKHTVLGFRDSWTGLLEDDSIRLRPNNIDDIQNLGGTVLGSSKSYPLADPKEMKQVAATVKKNKIFSKWKWMAE